ncbi:serine hydrolase domain-containing protein [Sphingomicrobium flavum]|uniref:serine hydrolase domain-containing protein n=1 Tax=Sphingomicrobium flavum TaxID=1229164 RepID=UPI0021ADE410|nr:serine hydrolase domain-containing protein [Sphingomicrobium flavum]
MHPILPVIALMVSPANMTPERAVIEQRLVPQVQFVGEEGERLSISDRQAKLGVDYAAVAVWRDGKLEWAGAYGEGISPDTRFQAASLSKPVAAIAIAALAKEKGVSLDADIAPVLGQWLAPDSFNPDGLPITLRGLLSHTAGASVGGFPGYAADAEVASLLDVVRGKGNTPMVVIEAAQAGQFRYAGGGYQLAELWAETVTGQGFETIAERLVLAPIGMTRSTFAPLERRLPIGEVAPAQNGDGSDVPGGWNVYPEQAAASLWTTAPDFALFLGAYMAALEGRDDGIDPDIARAAIVPVGSDYALGIGAREVGGELVLSHSGSNRGYKSGFNAYPGQGAAIVAFANHDRGWQIVSDLQRSAAIAYGWPREEAEKHQRVAQDASLFPRLAGRYAGPDGLHLFTVMPEGPNLKVAINGRGISELVPISGDRFIDPEDGQIVTWRFGEDGAPVLSADGMDYPRLAD